MLGAPGLRAGRGCAERGEVAREPGQRRGAWGVDHAGVRARGTLGHSIPGPGGFGGALVGGVFPTSKDSPDGEAGGV